MEAPLRRGLLSEIDTGSQEDLNPPSSFSNRRSFCSEINNSFHSTGTHKHLKRLNLLSMDRTEMLFSYFVFLFKKYRYCVLQCTDFEVADLFCLQLKLNNRTSLETTGFAKSLLKSEKPWQTQKKSSK